MPLHCVKNKSQPSYINTSVLNVNHVAIIAVIV